ncbi:hypothetical protein SAMN05444722_1055 [Rhodovulum sp. ES.010]|nr:hypothetical protein SAMN05444722_1055 [Rhodovulum sp. ES.010]
MERHILNFTHSGAMFRIYANWKGEGTGKEELDAIMQRVEQEFGPAASSPSEFIEMVKDALRREGFEIFKA